jgi:hypothetical protein
MKKQFNRVTLRLHFQIAFSHKSAAKIQISATYMHSFLTNVSPIHLSFFLSLTHNFSRIKSLLLILIIIWYLLVEYYS